MNDLKSLSGGLVLIFSAACVDGASPEHEATAAITSASGLTSICDARPDVHALAWVRLYNHGTRIGRCHVPPASTQNSRRADLAEGMGLQRIDASPADTCVIRTGTGTYEVIFPELGAEGGIAHVTVNQDNPAQHCKVQDWTPMMNGDLRLRVACFDLAGAPTNAKFFAMFYNDGDRLASKEPNAYLWAERPTAASYQPTQRYQFNSSGAINSITRLSEGRYRARLPQMQRTDGLNHIGHVQVTAQGERAERCKVKGWSAAGADVEVEVDCRLPEGTFSDSAFTLSYMSDPGELGFMDATDRRYAVQVYSGQPQGRRRWYPDPAFQRDSLGNTNVVEVEMRSSNAYRVFLHGVTGAPRGSYQVTAVGDSDAHCTAVGITDRGDLTEIGTHCFDSVGNIVQSDFAIYYTTDDQVP